MRSLLHLVKDNCRSITGGNLRKILLDTNICIEPGVTQGIEFNNYQVYKIPEGQEWRIPLIVSLMELRDTRWELLFDEESDKFSEDDVTFMINNVCID